uniref:Uncharacterized protein n=1 Tax=Erinnyis ello granulovirus TaxID=307444 RepID=A0A288WJ14_9BBAC|nr:hypothetical protein EREL_053 [Erinnyis ello granulovirus]
MIRFILYKFHDTTYVTTDNTNRPHNLLIKTSRGSCVTCFATHFCKTFCNTFLQIMNMSFFQKY